MTHVHILGILGWYVLNWTASSMGQDVSDQTESRLEGIGTRHGCDTLAFTDEPHLTLRKKRPAARSLCVNVST